MSFSRLELCRSDATLAASFRIKLMGAPGVGRRSLLLRLATKNWVNNVDEVVEALPRSVRSLARFTMFSDLNTMTMTATDILVDPLAASSTPPHTGMPTLSASAPPRQRSDSVSDRPGDCDDETLAASGVPVRFAFSDLTTESDRVETLTSLRSFHAFVIVADPSTFDGEAIGKVITTRQTILNVFTGRAEPPIILVFSKSDVSGEIPKYADLMSLFGQNLLLCSALTGEGCDDLFKLLASMLIDYHRDLLEQWLIEHGSNSNPKQKNDSPNNNTADQPSSSSSTESDAKTHFLRRGFRKLRSALFSSSDSGSSGDQQPVATSSAPAITQTTASSPLGDVLTPRSAVDRYRQERIEAILAQPVVRKSRDRRQSAPDTQDLVQQRLDSIILQLSNIHSYPLSSSAGYNLMFDEDKERDTAQSQQPDDVDDDVGAGAGDVGFPIDRDNIDYDLCDDETKEALELVNAFINKDDNDNNDNNTSPPDSPKGINSRSPSPPTSPKSSLKMASRSAISLSSASKKAGRSSVSNSTSSLPAALPSLLSPAGITSKKASRSHKLSSSPTSCSAPTAVPKRLHRTKSHRHTTLSSSPPSKDRKPACLPPALPLSSLTMSSQSSSSPPSSARSTTTSHSPRSPRGTQHASTVAETHCSPRSPREASPRDTSSSIWFSAFDTCSPIVPSPSSSLSSLSSSSFSSAISSPLGHPTLSSSSQTFSALRNQDLNHRFQEILEELSSFRQETLFDIMNKRYQALISKMVDLQQDFLSFVKLYGRIIIVERYVPAEQKTIKPIDMGGAAGGEKYLINGIMFKFAVDTMKRGGPMYGSDYAAAKVAGHELKGLENYMQCEVPELSFPLMCLVDFMGFRLVALTHLPLEPGSLRYGTENAGLETHCDPIFSSLMSRTATHLNLAPHLAVPSPGVLLHSACDIEGHEGFDGRRYLLDFSRSMPPVSPDFSIHNGHLFRLFRREAVRAYEKPLCPDAFSGFISCDPNRRQFNDDIRDATAWLLTEVIPRRSREIARQILEHIELSTVLGVEPSYELHRHGINMRYLGHIIDALLKSSDPKFEVVAIVLLIETIARVIKNSLRRILRSQMQSLKVALVSPYASTIIRYLNIVLSEPPQHNPSSPCDLSESVVSAWTSIAFFVQKTFDVDAAAVARLFKLPSTTPGYYTYSRVLAYQFAPDITGRLYLFHRFQTLTRVRLLSTATEQLGLPIFAPFADHDFVKPGCRIKSLSLMSTSVALRQLAMCRQGMLDARTTVKVLKSAETRLQAALAALPLSSSLLYQKALLHHCRLQLSSQQKDRTQADFILADHLFQICIGQLKHAGSLYALENIYYSYARFLVEADLFERAEHYFLLALELCTDSPRTVASYISLLAATDHASPYISQFQERLALLETN